MSDQDSLQRILQAFQMKDDVELTDMQGQDGFVRQVLRPGHDSVPPDEELLLREDALLRLGVALYGAISPDSEEAKVLGERGREAAHDLYVQVTGVVFRKNGEPFVRVREGAIGCVIYGPYKTFDAGTYEVRFDIDADQSFRDDGRDFCRVDVTANLGQTVIGQSVVNSNDIKKGGTTPVCVRFSLEAPTALEFRLHSAGTHVFEVRYERSVTALVE